MSQELLVPCTAAEALVAARLLEGGDAEGAAAALLLEASAAGGNAAVLRRARWLHALAHLLAPSTAPVAHEELSAAQLRTDLEGVRDEPPSDGTALDWARQHARRILEAEEALDEARCSALAGDEERLESALSMAFVGLDEFGPAEEARRCLRATEVLRLARAHTRAESLLRTARQRFAEAGDRAREIATTMQLGGCAEERADLRAAWSAFDEARALAHAHELRDLELRALRRLLSLAAARRDPRALHQLIAELEALLECVPGPQAEACAETCWVIASVLLRASDRTRAIAALKRVLEFAERARSMPLAWLAAAQLGAPLPSELVRRLQQPPIELEDLLRAADAVAAHQGDPELQRGFLEAALRMMNSMPDQNGMQRKECEARLADLVRFATAS